MFGEVGGVPLFLHYREAYLHGKKTKRRTSPPSRAAAAVECPEAPSAALARSAKRRKLIDFKTDVEFIPLDSDDDDGGEQPPPQQQQQWRRVNVSDILRPVSLPPLPTSPRPPVKNDGFALFKKMFNNNNSSSSSSTLRVPPRPLRAPRFPRPLTDTLRELRRGGTNPFLITTGDDGRVLFKETTSSVVVVGPPPPPPPSMSKFLPVGVPNFLAISEQLQRERVPLPAAGGQGPPIPLVVMVSATTTTTPLPVVMTEEERRRPTSAPCSFSRGQQRTPTGTSSIFGSALRDAERLVRANEAFVRGREEEEERERQLPCWGKRTRRVGVLTTPLLPSPPPPMRPQLLPHDDQSIAARMTAPLPVVFPTLVLYHGDEVGSSSELDTGMATAKTTAWSVFGHTPRPFELSQPQQKGACSLPADVVVARRKLAASLLQLPPPPATRGAALLVVPRPPRCHLRPPTTRTISAAARLQRLVYGLMGHHRPSPLAAISVVDINAPSLWSLPAFRKIVRGVQANCRQIEPPLPPSPAPVSSPPRLRQQQPLAGNSRENPGGGGGQTRHNMCFLSESHDAVGGELPAATPSPPQPRSHPPPVAAGEGGDGKKPGKSNRKRKNRLLTTTKTATSGEEQQPPRQEEAEKPAKRRGSHFAQRSSAELLESFIAMRSGVTPLRGSRQLIGVTPESSTARPLTASNQRGAVTSGRAHPKRLALPPPSSSSVTTTDAPSTTGGPSSAVPCAATTTAAAPALSVCRIVCSEDMLQTNLPLLRALRSQSIDVVERDIARPIDLVLDTSTAVSVLSADRFRDDDTVRKLSQEMLTECPKFANVVLLIAASESQQTNADVQYFVNIFASEVVNITSISTIKYCFTMDQVAQMVRGAVDQRASIFASQLSVSANRYYAPSWLTEEPTPKERLLCSFAFINPCSAMCLLQATRGSVAKLFELVARTDTGRLEDMFPTIAPSVLEALKALVSADCAAIPVGAAGNDGFCTQVPNIVHQKTPFDTGQQQQQQQQQYFQQQEHSWPQNGEDARQHGSSYHLSHYAAPPLNRRPAHNAIYSTNGYYAGPGCEDGAR